MNDADAAFLRQRDRETGFGDGVHRGRDQWQVQPNRFGQLRGERDIAGMNVAQCGNEQNIIKRQGFLNEFHVLHSDKYSIIREPIGQRIAELLPIADDKHATQNFA